MNNNSFFLRFYGRTDEEIKKCIEELKVLGIKPIKTDILDADITMNLFIPEEYKPVREASLYFSTYEETVRSRNFPGLEEVYHRWSMKNRPEGAVTTLREYGDAAWGLQGG